MIAPDLLWRYALAVIPVAVAVALLCRCLPCRPSTRHTLWLSLLLFLVVAPFLPAAPVLDLAAMVPPAADAPADALAETDAPAALSTTTRPGATGAAAPFATPRETPAAAPSRPRPEPRPEPRPGPTPRGVTPLFTFAPAIEANAPAIVAPSAPSRDRTDAIPALIRSHPAGVIVNPVRIDVADLAPAASSVAAATPAPAVARSPHRPAVAVAASTTPPPSAPRPDAAAHERTVTAAAQWIATLRTIRDAGLSLPPIPTVIWAGGAAVLVGLLFVRIARFRRLLRAALPAPPDVTALVAKTAADLELRRPPATLMVSERISPMVWCGRRACLLLPEALWRDLDPVGRHAIVCHELAHLRRRDHWVSWIETIVGCVYWWHPIVWWIRRRLRDEADLSCDAWVTTLMPTARRRYATVLLETKQFTSARTPAVPVVQLGVATNHAKRFARRLTMVMTQQLTPKLTLGGVLLVCAVAAGSWLVTPTLACDPVKAPKAAKAPKAPKAPRALRLLPSAPSPLTAPTPATAPTSFEQFVDSRGGDDEELEDRLRSLERQLERLREQLHGWGKEMEHNLPGMLERLHEIEIPEIQLFDDDDDEHGHDDDDHGHGEGHGDDGGHARLPGVAGECECVGGSQTCDCEEISRTYALPSGKLEALTELMGRSDVPVLVSIADTQITLHGSLAQHHVFGAFVSLINSKDEQRDYVLSEGKLEALSELMIRADVPVLVSPRCESIRVHGNSVEQGIFGAFVRMIGPETAGKNRPAAARGPQAELAERYRAAASAESDDDSARADAMAVFRAVLGARGVGADSADPQHYWRLAEQLEARARALEEQAEMLEAQAEEIEDRAEEMEERAEELEEAQEEDRD